MNLSEHYSSRVFVRGARFYTSILVAIGALAGCTPKVWIGGGTYPITDVCLNEHCDLSAPTVRANPNLARVIAQGIEILGQTGSEEAISADPVDPTRTHHCAETSRPLALGTDYVLDGISEGSARTETLHEWEANVVLKAFGIVAAEERVRLSSKVVASGQFQVERFVLTEAGRASLEACREKFGGTIVVGVAVMTSAGKVDQARFDTLKASVLLAIAQSGNDAKLKARVEASTEESVSTAFSSVSYALVWKTSSEAPLSAQHK
jgi:hypothetical protein